jgi:hypothetical protein
LLQKLRMDLKSACCSLFGVKDRLVVFPVLVIGDSQVVVPEPEGGRQFHEPLIDFDRFCQVPLLQVRVGQIGPRLDDLRIEFNGFFKGLDRFRCSCHLKIGKTQIGISRA